MTRLLSRALAATVVAAVVLTACGGADPESAPGDGASVSGDGSLQNASVSFVAVGSIDDSDAFIAVAIDGDTATVYLCDGAKEWADLEGAVSGRRIVADAPDGRTLTATIDGDTIAGEVTLSDGTTHTFGVERASGDAGLFVQAESVDDGLILRRWIRLPDGSARGKVVATTAGSDLSGTEESAEGIPPSAQEPSPEGAIKCARAALAYRRAVAASASVDAEDDRAGELDIAVSDAHARFLAACNAVG